ncbi:MAG: ferrochelatase [Nitrospirae bacterium]|nr:ferrochelatase [Nitrospirota bacterium]
MAGINKEITGVVLLNLGGPDSLQAVRPFLYNLFSDREIIKLGPPFLQKPVACLVSALRSKKTEAMYEQIGGKSPMLDITQSQAEALEKALNQGQEDSSQYTVYSSQGEENDTSLVTPAYRTGRRHSSLSFKVYAGMRYWHPFISETVKKIIDDGVKDLIVLSLYPQYSKATTGSSIAEFKKSISRVKGQGSGVRIQYIEQWYDFPPYINAFAELIAKGIAEYKGDSFDVLYSAHSLPESFIKEGDPYLDHMKSTIDAINSSLVTRHLLPYKWHLSFQSKSGPVKWLEPSTEETIIKLANKGCKNLFVIPISFVSDHIETLYEIDILYKKIAEKCGIILKRCPSLNTSERFIFALKELIMTKIELK